nr:PREDICTED: zona pellucida sperm-binding protein 3-like [Lepisosteus oculatus]
MFFLWSLVAMGLFFTVPVLTQQGHDITVSCGQDSITVSVDLKVRSLLPLDPSGLLLGSCPVSNVAQGQAVFQSEFLDCRFMRMATADILVYKNVLTYQPTTSAFYPSPFSEPIECTYVKSPDWTPPLYNPALGDASGFGTLTFSMDIMADDFSAPRVSTTFFLGSLIPIQAAVDQQFHMPLILFLEECVAATTAVLSPSSQTYSLINNYGCFEDSKTSNSRFLPRSQTSNIQVLVQAFKFMTQNDVYLHCQLVAWDPARLNDPTKKACNFNKTTNRWELLDDPSQYVLCDCCTSSCVGRRKRDADVQGLRHTTVLGPLRIVPEEDPGDFFETKVPAVIIQEEDPVPIWVIFLAGALLVTVLLGALSLMYYFCVWSPSGVQTKPQSELLIPAQIDEVHRVVGIHCSFPKES